MRRANINITIFPLAPSDSKELSTVLLSQNDEYSQYFSPFDFTHQSLEEILIKAVNDRYWGIRCGNSLAGFFMLRGIDDGYERPSFGVYIREQFSRRGLGKLALHYALSWCRINNIKSVMLKVHPENIHAQRIYTDAGFKFLEVCPQTGHNVFERHWESNP